MSRWHMNRLGLVNFWYYDDQEFVFVKGRLLLRGSNGSGKSVTMQSAVPLLLDGNLSAERIDPFGSRDRHVDTYLLDEDDPREERTGYLYLEFKKEDSDTYMTIGIGLRKRRGKKLDRWYFAIRDGRRVGRDFFLYREAADHTRVPLTSRELTNRLGEGGDVFLKQSEYMAFVNRQLFGFENVDAFKEMLDLLIQLRTPKLSKDFKPSVINEILSSSLQPLSDDDLRPMAESIENMDRMQLNLETKIAGKEAAARINNIYDTYNRLVLYTKANDLYEEERSAASLKKAQEETLAEKQRLQDELEELHQQKTDLGIEYEKLSRESENLKRSNAFELKEKETKLNDTAKGYAEDLRRKEKELEDKEERRIETDASLKEKEDQIVLSSKKMDVLLEEMAEEASSMSYDEHAFMRDELHKAADEPFDFDLYTTRFDEEKKNINTCYESLLEADKEKRRIDEATLRHDKKKKEVAEAESDVKAKEELFVEAQNDWKENVNLWHTGTSLLKIPGETMNRIMRYADHYNAASSFDAVRNLVYDASMPVRNECDRRMAAADREIDELTKEKETVQQELEEWENRKDPEPERTPEVLLNRKKLTEAGIPFTPFFKAVSFAQGLAEETCNVIEEALYRMGILDALIIEDQYKEQVLSLDTTGNCDTYLFTGKVSEGRKLSEVLSLDEAVDDMFLMHYVNRTLDSISFSDDGIIAVDENGIWHNGVVTGTGSHTYQAGYIGAAAREKTRALKIQACQEKIEELDIKIHEQEAYRKNAEESLAVVNTEYTAFPQDDEIRRTFQEEENALRELAFRQEERKRIENEIAQMRNTYSRLKIAAEQIAAKLYLACELHVFEEAKEAAGSYDHHLLELKGDHREYLSLCEARDTFTNILADLEGDEDRIRGDISVLKRKQRETAAEIDSIIEQLKSTDYEEIKDRLDYCVAWLKAYPDQTAAMERKLAQSEDRLENVRKEEVEREGLILSSREKTSYLFYRLNEEYKLSSSWIGVFDDYEEMPKAYKIRELLSSVKDRNLYDVSSKLQETFFSQKGVLNDYQLTRTDAFKEIDRQYADSGYPTCSRIDYRTRYRGVDVPLSGLVKQLEEEIERDRQLIRDNERELFEDILANTVGRKIRNHINASDAWVAMMNRLMKDMNTSSGMKLSLRWTPLKGSDEEELDTAELVDLLRNDAVLLNDAQAEKLSRHFRAKVSRIKQGRDSGETGAFYQLMKDTLDYRQWFEFRLMYEKEGGSTQELTNSKFNRLSGGEKAMAMYVPLFSAAAARYKAAGDYAPMIISLDEAFAGVDTTNIRDMFRLTGAFGFDFIMNSQVLWGDYDTLDALAVYELIRPQNATFVTTMPYIWNGHTKEMIEDEKEMEETAGELSS